jgi:uncharacterized damage-inducible protein DinB
MDPLGALFAHHAWATLRLIDHCAALPADRLQATVPGTYGTIERTLIHLVAADQRYLEDMDGQRAGIELSERERHSLAEVRAAAELQAARWASLVRRAPELNVTRPAYDEDPDSPHAEDLLFLQAIHHGNDHRAHVCTILGAHGLEVPELGGWTYWHEERLPAEQRSV